MKLQQTLLSGVTLAAATLTLTACGSSFQSQGSAACSSVTPTACNSSSSSGGNSTSDVSSAWDKLNVAGAVSGGSYNGTQVVTIDKTTKEIVLQLPMPAIPFAMPASQTIPSLSGAHIGLETDASGNSVVTLRVPLSMLLKGADLAVPSALPNGDPLPSIPGGELPSIAVSLGGLVKLKTTVYLAPSIIGVFVATSFDPYIGLTLPIRSADGTRTWGYLTSVPAKKGLAQGGFFMSFKLPDDIARVLEDVL